MSLLGNLNTAADVAEDVDSVGGNGPFESGIYDMTVNMAFVKKSEGGATAVVLHLTDDASGRELRQTLWVSSGDAKGNKTYYETQDGQKKNLPGFSLFRSLCLMTLNKEPAAVGTEEKVIKLWNREAKAEVPTTVDCITELLNQKIIAGIFKQTVDRTAKGDDGKYYPTGETRDENEIDKFFHAGTRMTLAEATGGKETGEFIDVWAAKNTGNTRDRSEGKAQGGGATPAQSGTFGAATSGGAAPQPKSLFG